MSDPDSILMALLVRAREVAANIAAAGHKDAAVMIGKLANQVAKLKGEADGLEAVIRVLKARLAAAQEEEVG